MAAKPERGRAPDYDVCVLDDETEERGNIGAAWLCENGDINIKINPFVQLPGNMGRYKIRLFPREGKEERFKDKDARSNKNKKLSKPPKDDIPF